MDTSNPIISSDRMSLVEVYNSSLLRKRQNLAALANVAATSTRTRLKVDAQKLPKEECCSLINFVQAQCPKVEEAAEVPLSEDAFALRFDSVPVCGVISSEKEVLHPPGVNQKQGHVFVRRTYGGTKRAPLGLFPFVEIVGEDVKQISDKVYTYGTRSGFHTRLNEQMGRKTVSWSVSWSKLLGIPIKGDSFKIFKERVLMHIPLGPRLTKWPALDAPLLEQLKCIKTTGNSSAGAPYWRNKADCTAEVLNVGMPLILKALEEKDGILKLMREEPEMFLVEIKNKLDRYSAAEVSKKTRPYTCVPAHFSYLFSVPCQRFQERLVTFVQNPKSANAYGFSSAHGGLMKMVHWMESVKEGDMKWICYGDDSRIMWRKDGLLYMANPDFKQMDGSVDYDIMKMTIQWVYETLLEEDDMVESPFWKNVMDLWLWFATTPFMIIEGSEVYQKKTKGGLMTGVTGTTLFDTVKAISAWASFKEEWKNGRVTVEAQSVTKYMKDQCGLVIKEGTWDPVVVKPFSSLDYGDLYCEQKFLGIQISKDFLDYGAKTQDIAVPTIPYEEMVEMFIVQKDDPFIKDKSGTAKSRLLFDRCRGIFITFGFTDADMVNAIHNIVNGIDPAAILMATQVPGGQKASSILLTGMMDEMEDFQYPTSSGFPSEKFCRMLYASDIDDEERANEWVEIFPELSTFAKSLRTEERIKIRGRTLDEKGEFILPVMEPVVQAKTLEDIVDAPLPIEGVAQGPPPKNVKVNKRSKIQVVDPTGSVIETPKRIPAPGSIVYDLVKKSGGLVSVSEVIQKTGLTIKSILKDAPTHKYILSGTTADDIVSTVPLQKSTQISENIIGKMKATGKKEVQAIFKESQKIVNETRLVKVSDQLLETLEPVEIVNVDNLRQAFNQFLAKNKKGFKFSSATPIQLRDAKNTILNSVDLFIGDKPSANTPEIKNRRLVGTASGPSKKVCEDSLIKEFLEKFRAKVYKEKGVNYLAQYLDPLPGFQPKPREVYSTRFDREVKWDWNLETDMEMTGLAELDEDLQDAVWTVERRVNNYCRVKGLPLEGKLYELLLKKAGPFLLDDRYSGFSFDDLMDGLVFSYTEGPQKGKTVDNTPVLPSIKAKIEDSSPPNPFIASPEKEEVNPFLGAIEALIEERKEDKVEEILQKLEKQKEDQAILLPPEIDIEEAYDSDEELLSEEMIIPPPPEFCDDISEDEESDMEELAYDPVSVEAESLRVKPPQITLVNTEEVKPEQPSYSLALTNPFSPYYRSHPVSIKKKVEPQTNPFMPDYRPPIPPRVIIPKKERPGKKTVSFALPEKTFEEIQEACKTYREAVKLPKKNARPNEGPPPMVKAMAEGLKLEVPKVAPPITPPVPENNETQFPRLGRGKALQVQKKKRAPSVLEFKDYSLLDVYADIAHAIGKDARFGKGIALSIKKQFPEAVPSKAEIPYLQEGGFYAKKMADGFVVYSIVTKPFSSVKGVEKPGREKYLKNLETGLSLVLEDRKERNAEGFLHVPAYIGAGLDGLVPKDVWAVLTKVAEQYKTKIVLCFPPKTKQPTQITSDETSEIITQANQDAKERSKEGRKSRRKRSQKRRGPTEEKGPEEVSS